METLNHKKNGTFRVYETPRCLSVCTEAINTDTKTRRVVAFLRVVAPVPTGGYRGPKKPKKYFCSFLPNKILGAPLEQFGAEVLKGLIRFFPATHLEPLIKLALF